MLDIYAGPKALQRIVNDGFSPSLFDTILGASGGPKWFVLAGLDRVIIPEFFASTSHPLNVIGSSAGAFRAACMAQNDPKAAINRLAHHYANTVYNDKPSPFDITQSVYSIMDKLMGTSGVAEILSNKRVKAHFIVARAKGLTRYEHKALQIPGLLMSAGLNAISRKSLQHFYDRVVFSTDHLGIACPYGLASETVMLNADNLIPALTASGSIPAIMEGVTDIPGAAPGMYRDGGIIDYHFDLAFPAQEPNDALTLYPHFYAQPIPGWFDKSLKRRTPHAKNYDNVVMLVPSAEFVANLPYAKIPDRTDFATMEAEQRIAYWTRVIAETDRLGDEFLRKVDDDNIASYIKPFVF